MDGMDGFSDSFLDFFPVENFGLGALLDLWFEGKRLLLTIDVELDFSGSHMNTCICGAQEQPPKDERCLGVNFHVEDDEVYGNKEIPGFHQNVLRYSRGVANRLVR